MWPRPRTKLVSPHSHNPQDRAFKPLSQQSCRPLSGLEAHCPEKHLLSQLPVNQVHNGTKDGQTQRAHAHLCTREGPCISKNYRRAKAWSTKALIAATSVSGAASTCSAFTSCSEFTIPPACSLLRLEGLRLWMGPGKCSLFHWFQNLSRARSALCRSTSAWSSYVAVATSGEFDSRTMRS